MGRRDLHVHTTFSDGANTPAEMVLTALAAGLDTIGFSDHAYTSIDESYCMPRSRVQEYRTEIARLRWDYRGRIEILCGIEQDYWSDDPAQGYDYVIGSVHYVEKDGVCLPVDESPEILRAGCEELFGGDPYALVRAYYALEADVVRRTGAHIIGHFDLITKFLERDPLFDERDPRYRRAWQAAADALLATGAVFEINTGAMARGCRTDPYPSREIRDYLRRKGAEFILSSDSHRADGLCHAFDTII